MDLYDVACIAYGCALGLLVGLTQSMPLLVVGLALFIRFKGNVRMWARG